MSPWVICERQIDVSFLYFSFPAETWQDGVQSHMTEELFLMSYHKFFLKNDQKC